MKKIVFLFMSIVLACSTMVAQTFQVKGVVIDENNEPIVGAAVMVKGSQRGSLSDVDGGFVLNNVKQGEKLVVSYVGMKTKTVDAKTSMRIMLETDNKVLDEVIVVAFGEQKKSSFTGSAGLVGSDKIAERQVNNVVDALNGQVAGVQMYNSSGDPASTPTIRIRGISSINAGKDPLIVVDGAPFNGSWSDINPADVASMTVLKDAASNALYGARGANGVIMITTKNAQKGKAVVTLDAKWGSNSRASRTYDVIDNPAQYYEVHYNALLNYYMNSRGYDFAQAHAAANNLMSQNSSVGGLSYICYSVPQGQYLIGDNGKLNPQATLGNVITYEGQEYTIRPDDWLKAAYRNTLRQEYNMNVSGGNEAAEFYASLGFLDNPGIAYGSKFKRYSGRLKASYKANDWLKVGGNLNYARTVTDYADENYGTDTFTAINGMAPIYPLYVRDGNGNLMSDKNGVLYDYGNGMNGGLLRPVMTQMNPLRDDQLQASHQVGNSFGVNGFADITPSFVKGLKLTLNGTINNYEYRYNSTVQPFYGTNGTTYPNGYVQVGHYRTYTVNFQQLINYVRSFGKHNVTLMAGHENFKNTYEYVTGSRSNMFSFETNHELSGAITNQSTNSTQTNYNTEGFFFRGMYDYDNKYFGQVSFRRDGSSNFDPDHCWGNFYSFGGAWILSKEDWMEPTQNWLDMLKLKFSFGQQGNDAIGSSRYFDLYSISSMAGELALNFSFKGNRNITWETNTNINAGVEFELFKGRLQGEVEYFYRKTTDMLCWLSVPLSFGYSGYYSNVGNMVNKGVELTLSGDVIRTKDFTWSLNLNATHYTNEITSLHPENMAEELEGYKGYQDDGYYFYGVGLPIYTFRLKRYAGVDEEGNSTWYVKDEDGQLTTTNRLTEGSYFACGDPTPDLYGGFGTSLSYKGIDLSVGFSYSLGGKVIDFGYASLMNTPHDGLTGFAIHKDMLNAWSPTNTTSNIPRLQYGDSDVNAISDRFLISGSWLSLQNINMGYSLPKKWITGLGLSNVRLYAAADKVFLCSNRKGLEPRTSVTGSPSSVGYAFVRTISGGITLQF